jgi:hypothetical protein
MPLNILRGWTARSISDAASMTTALCSGDLLTREEVIVDRKCRPISLTGSMGRGGRRARRLVASVAILSCVVSHAIGLAQVQVTRSRFERQQNAEN